MSWIIAALSVMFAGFAWAICRMGADTVREIEALERELAARPRKEKANG